MPKFQGPQDGVDSYDVWKSNRMTGCLCDWCKFRWVAACHQQAAACDWQKPEWGMASVSHSPGTAVAEFACCVQVESSKITGQFFGLTTGPGSIWTDPLSESDVRKELAVLKGAVKAIGHNCSRCNSRNDYAASNQKDGSYVCYECR